MKINMDTIFKELVSKKNCLLGAGPMSTNSVDAIIQLSDSYKIPIQLIASRRQVDSHFHGGGYVNNWSTTEFSDYVRKKTKHNLVFLSRDHSGPWQGEYEVEKNFKIDQAMESSKKSLEEDIDSGFRFLHLDPSVDLHNKLSIDTILNRLFELYGHVYEYSKGLDEIFIEIGTDLQSDMVSTLEETEYILEKIKKFTSKEISHKPSFFVIQNGTKVLETENVGEYKHKIDNDKNFQNKILSLTKLINNYEVLIKAHNCDYLESKTLGSFVEYGINAVNIAPEYGVAETREIIRLCKKYNLQTELDSFLEMSLLSNKWKKWLKPDTCIDDHQKAIISGHYIFSKEDFNELKRIISFKLKQKEINFESQLYQAVYNSVKNTLKGLNWIKDD